MDRKILAIIIVLIAIGGAYGLLYAGVNVILKPTDLMEYNSELSSVLLPVNNDSTLNEIENAATLTDSMSALSYTSQSERTQMANDMRTFNIVPTISTKNFEEYDKFNSFRMTAYYLIGRGDISDAIKNVSSTYKEITRLNNETNNITQKMANDLEKGDNKAYASDLKNIANNTRNYNEVMAKLKNQLENLINLLEN